MQRRPASVTFLVQIGGKVCIVHILGYALHDVISSMDIYDPVAYGPPLTRRQCPLRQA